MRAPEAPIGWPKAIAPPLTLTFVSSMPRIRIEPIATEAKASLISQRSTSSGSCRSSPAPSAPRCRACGRGRRSRRRPSRRRGPWRAACGLPSRPTPRRRRRSRRPRRSRRGRCPRCGWRRRRRSPSGHGQRLQGRPRAWRLVGLDRGVALAALDRPPGRSPPRSGPPPSPRRRAYCERTANLSMSARVISISLETSDASLIICLWVKGLVSPSWVIASSACTSPIRKPKRAFGSSQGAFASTPSRR